MKKKVLPIILCCIIVLLMAGTIAYYVYDIYVNGTPAEENIVRVLAIVVCAIGALVKLFAPQRRRSGLEVYEKAYEKEIGQAFINNKPMRKKLLCAIRLYNENKYDKALKNLAALLKDAESDRDRVSVLLFIAICYSDAGFTEDAIKAYNRLLQLDYRHAQAHSNLGLLYDHEGNYDMALQHFKKSIDIEPQNYYAYANRANCYFRQVDYANAEKDALKALEIKNNGKEMTSLLAIIYALENNEEGKNKYFQMSVNNGQNPDELKNAVEFFRKGQASEENNTAF